MALTYTTYVNSLVNLLPVPSAGDAGFATVLPNIIDDAENRLYRELDLLNTVVRDSSSTLTTLTRTFNLPSSIGTFVVTDEINIITPSTATNPELGTRNSLTPASKEMLDMLWPSITGSTVPTYFAMVSQSTIVVGPWPDAAYTVEVVGTIRPQPIGTTNVTTLLSVYFPDCLIAASMIFASGYMKNFGAAVDDPRAGVTWESHLQELLKSAHVEEARKKFTSAGWSSKEPAPLATPPRT
jgi:hypothetical protein